MALIHEMCLTMAEEPQALEEAINDENWVRAMREELRMIEKKKRVAQSEAEYIAVCSAASQAIWLQRVVNEIGFKVEKGVRIFCDNKSSIAIGKNPVQHRRTKHTDIKYHFVREAEQNGKIKLEYCPGELQIADILTKPLTTTRFEFLRERARRNDEAMIKECWM